MKGKYDKNYTEKGYLMNYKKGPTQAHYSNRVLQFRIELKDISPLVWRRILSPSDYNFWGLHVAIQDSMGWQDKHLHHFQIKRKHGHKSARIGIPDFDGVFSNSPEIFPGWEIPVIKYFNALGITANYLYDYGDSWEHSVQLEGYLYKKKGSKYPCCIDGARACPPEDCGGVNGYSHLLEILSDPQDSEYEHMKSWIGENWGPEKFHKDRVKFDNPYFRWKNAFLKK